MNRELRLDKRIETLRAFIVSGKQIDEGNLTKYNKFYTKADLVTMQAFKAIYGLGIGQLLKFIKYISDGAAGINEYAVQYYCIQLKNGPLYRWVKKYTYNFQIPFWRNPPDIYNATKHLMMSNIHTAYTMGDASEYGDLNTFFSEITAYKTNMHNVTRTKMPRHMEKMARNVMIQGSFAARSALGSGVAVDQYHQLKAGYYPGYNYPHGGYGTADIGTWFNLYKAAYKSGDWGGSTQSSSGGEKDHGLHMHNLHANPYWDGSRSRAGTPAFESLLRWTIPYYVPEDKEIKLDKYVNTDLSGKVFASPSTRGYTVQIPLSARPDQVIKEYKLHTVLGQFGSGYPVKEDPIV